VLANWRQDYSLTGNADYWASVQFWFIRERGARVCTTGQAKKCQQAGRRSFLHDLQGFRGVFTESMEAKFGHRIWLVKKREDRKEGENCEGANDLVSLVDSRSGVHRSKPTAARD